jgi:hypothetical protein
MHDHEPAGQRGYSATGALYWAARRVWAGDLSTPDERNTDEFETPTDGGWRTCYVLVMKLIAQLSCPGEQGWSTRARRWQMRWG